ncbi:hypothetical protein M422DRAFT_264680 [Sphaerobolus stellatus SS14]|uniref:Uncharacterized protein n=1 Tax=Sphaerobolus stellatus (strain SS14) TaxID=990650 RepID=A0A0C9V7Q4_SPHS4|nr:hypothetical protein M422DRAFT_264680 [Sphaerobolus stellatus SS14]
MALNSTSKARVNAADIQVIGLGLSHTGTFSLSHALESLGFGLANIHSVCPKPIGWSCGKLEPPPEIFDMVLRGYKSVVDSPAAITAKDLYAAYPNAKFVLTTRSPVAWGTV